MWKFLVILVAFWVTGCGTEATTQQPKTHQWVEDNDLWMEDGFNYYAGYNVDQSMFNQIINLGEQLYSPVASQWGERLNIVRMWEDPTVNASAWRDGRGNTEIRMYGGMARRPEVLPLSFALVLCHELNHLYGGRPYLDNGLRISAEGQSDWGGAGWCLRNIAERLQDGTAINPTPYMQQVCGQNQVCLRRLAGGNGLGSLLARLSGEMAPRYETPDRTVVSRTELSYPRTIQCRLDTYHNGILSRERPRCWYRN